MLQLLSPTSLWALAALALPLAIHLWRPPPRTVRLGSLRFLEDLPRRLHDLRWRERWLLAARLALLALLALLLAAPRWQRRPPHGPQHWILLDPTAAPFDGSLDRLHALQSAGYETRTLASGFPMMAHAALLRPDAAVPDLWSLLREADAELPAGSSLAVLTPGRMASLRGSRPTLQHARVEWVRTPDTLPSIASVKPSATPVALPLGVLILYDADRAGDARYLSAAIRAVAQVSRRALNLQTGVANPSLDNKSGVAWMFWLSAQPLPAAWMERDVNVVSETSDVGNPPDFPTSWIIPAPDVSGASAFLDPVRLWRRTASPAAFPGVVDWTDGFGRPLLTSTREARGQHWRFYGRFDPAWTDLPCGSALAAWLRGLLLGQGNLPTLDPVHDRRLADPSQGRTSDMPPARANVTLSRAGENSVDLRALLWMLAAILFGLERVWSHRRRPVATVTGPVAEPAAISSR